MHTIWLVSDLSRYVELKHVNLKKVNLKKVNLAFPKGVVKLIWLHSLATDIEWLGVARYKR